MKKELIWTFVALAALLIFAQAGAASMMIPINDHAAQAPASEKSPAIGDGWELERVDFIHYAKPPGTNKPPKGSGSCYALTGYSWKTLPVSYVINPNNPQGLSGSFVTSTIGTAAETWDAATSSELFNNTYTIDGTAQYGVQDYQNSIVFGDYPDNNVIAVTSMWFIPRGHRMVEFDMEFNTRYTWGDASIDASVMDLQNIATHELGHSAGLNDIYSTSCSAVTMYGYSSNGEMSKRTLEQADIGGLRAMYGL
jgi:hypothetical protein